MAGSTTRTESEAVLPLTAAKVTVHVPHETGVIRPVSSSFATEGSEEVKVSAVIVVFDGERVTSGRQPLPPRTSVSCFLSRRMEATGMPTCTRHTAVWPDASRAMTSHSPTALPVTTPVRDTVATEGLDELQTTLRS